MRLYDVIWNERFVAKIAEKRAVSTDEAEEDLFSKPHVCRLKKGKLEASASTWPMVRQRRGGIS